MNIDWYVNVCVLLVYTCLCLFGKMIGTLVGTPVGTPVVTFVGMLDGGWLPAKLLIDTGCSSQ